MSKQQPDPKRIYASIIIAFGWLLFLALWLFSYVTSFSILQKHSDFIGVYRRCSTVADFIVGSMVDETD